MASKHYKRFVELYGPSNQDFAKAMNDDGEAKIAREVGCSKSLIYNWAPRKVKKQWVALVEARVAEVVDD